MNEEKTPSIENPGNHGPIILVEDDVDDQELIKEIIHSFNLPNKILIFNNGHDVLDYLRKTTEQPFLILSDINLPKLNGLELRKEINSEQGLKEKCVPFVFLSTTANKKTVFEAYDLTVQGFFKKSNAYEEFRAMLKLIIDYWFLCRHPNN